MFCTEHGLSCVRLNKRIFDRIIVLHQSSGNQTKHSYDYMNSKMNNALSEYDRSLSANRVHVRQVY